MNAKDITVGGEYAVNIGWATRRSPYKSSIARAKVLAKKVPVEVGAYSWQKREVARGIKVEFVDLPEGTQRYKVGQTHVFDSGSRFFMEWSVYEDWRRKTEEAQAEEDRRKRENQRRISEMSSKLTEAGFDLSVGGYRYFPEIKGNLDELERLIEAATKEAA